MHFSFLWTNLKALLHSYWCFSETFWMQQPLLQMSKNDDFLVCFLHTGRKRSHSMPSQDYTANDSSNRCLGRSCSCLSWCVRDRIVMVKNDPSSADGFFCMKLSLVLHLEWKKIVFIFSFCGTQLPVIPMIEIIIISILWITSAICPANPQNKV